jgi:HEAT repeat protein
MRAFLLLLALSACGCACGCSQAPPLSGGKPVAHWVSALADPSPKVRKTAVCKLGNAGAADGEAWSALCGALRDRDAGVRREAIAALMKCGPRSREMVPVLNELERGDPDMQVRSFAGRALKKLSESEGHSRTF